jgi:hypothetical protein
MGTCCYLPARRTEASLEGFARQPREDPEQHDGGYKRQPESEAHLHVVRGAQNWTSRTTTRRYTRLSNVFSRKSRRS